MLTCWPVLTEAAYLLRDKPNEVRQLLANCRQGLLQILPLTVTDVPRMQSILDRFSDQHFQLADVALMHLAEREGFVKVFTLDHRDFSVFWKSDGTNLTMFPVNT